MTTKKEILEKLEKIKPELYRNFSVKEIGLFGSFANETFTANSDIDLLVEFEHPIGWKFLSLELYLEEVFKRKIDLVTKNALKSQIRDKILKTVNYVR